MITFIRELRRRNIFRVAGVYSVVSWLMIQIGVAVLPTFEAPKWILQVFILLIAAGFPFAVIMAWAFEMTPDGVRPTKTVSPERSISELTGRRLDYAIIAGLTLVAGLIIYNSFFAPKTLLPPAVVQAEAPASPETQSPLQSAQTEPQSQPSVAAAVYDKSILAVLPFANRSPREEDAYFAEGMHDDLLTQLANISALKVISRTSVMRFADTEVPIPEIARMLGAGVIMEGGVQRAGNRVQITLQLIDAEKDTHLWAETFNRELTVENIFEIQKEVTVAVAEATATILTQSELTNLNNKPTKNLKAYDAYIRGQLLSRAGVNGAKDYIAAIKAYDQATFEDPQFAQAYARKAYSELYLYWLFDRTPGHVENAKAALAKAQTLAPEAVDTLIAEAFYNYWVLQDYNLADQTLDQALLAAPNNPEIWAVKGYVARRDGRFDDTIKSFEKAQRLDPLNSSFAQSLAETYSELGYYDEARQMINIAKEIKPDSQWVRVTDAHIWWQKGDPQKAWETINVMVPSPDTFYFKQMLFYAIATRDPENVNFALSIWPEDKRGSETAPENYNIMEARALFALGQTRPANQLLKEIRGRIKMSDTPYPSGWSGNASYYPATVPGLSGNLRAVKAAVKDFEQNSSNDAWAERDSVYAIASAFASAGDPEAAFAYISKLTERFGPSIYNRLSINPEFDTLRDHPEYLALKVAAQEN